MDCVDRFCVRSGSQSLLWTCDLRWIIILLLLDSTATMWGGCHLSDVWD